MYGFGVAYHAILALYPLRWISFSTFASRCCWCSLFLLTLHPIREHSALRSQAMRIFILFCAAICLQAHFNIQGDARNKFSTRIFFTSVIRSWQSRYLYMCFIVRLNIFTAGSYVVLSTVWVEHGDIGVPAKHGRHIGKSQSLSVVADELEIIELCISICRCGTITPIRHCGTESREYDNSLELWHWSGQGSVCDQRLYDNDQTVGFHLYILLFHFSCYIGTDRTTNLTGSKWGSCASPKHLSKCH